MTFVRKQYFRDTAKVIMFLLKVFVNGDLREEARGQGLLSLDWGGKAGIGRHKHQFGNRLLRGMIDEFYIFPCELPRLEILVLLRHCRVYFSKFFFPKLYAFSVAYYKVRL